MPPFGLPTYPDKHGGDLVNERNPFVHVPALQAILEPFRRMLVDPLVTQPQRIAIYPHDALADGVTLFVKVMYVDVPRAINPKLTPSIAV